MRTSLLRSLRRPHRGRRHLIVALLAVAGIAVGLFLVRYETPKERFTDRASAVCEESKHELLVASRAQLSPAGSTRERQAEAFLTRILVPKLRERMAALRHLDAPDGDTKELRSLFRDYEAVIDAIAADPKAYARAGIDDPFAKVDRRFDDYGLPVCGSDPPK